MHKDFKGAMIVSLIEGSVLDGSHFEEHDCATMICKESRAIGRLRARNLNQHSIKRIQNLRCTRQSSSQVCCIDVKLGSCTEDI